MSSKCNSISASFLASPGVAARGPGVATRGTSGGGGGRLTSRPLAAMFVHEKRKPKMRENVSAQNAHPAVSLWCNQTSRGLARDVAAASSRRPVGECKQSWPTSLTDSVQSVFWILFRMVRSPENVWLNNCSRFRNVSEPRTY